MRLRRLEHKDAPFMLEWMHDSDVTQYMRADFSAKTLEDCEDFIAASLSDNCSGYILAVADDNDEYMGTVSLKHINMNWGFAEFAVIIRQCAMGKGYAKYAMQEIIRRGFQDLGLSAVYWCVAACNIRAVKFYDKTGYKRTSEAPDALRHMYNNDSRLIWYAAEQVSV